MHDGQDSGKHTGAESETRRRMKIGVVYPQTEMRGDPAAVARFGRAAEDLGFDHLVAYDHVLGAVHDGRAMPLNGPYTERDAFHDPFVMFSYLAGITDKLEFFTGVLVLPQRQTALVARQAADVALLSAGRLRLGVGVGWNRVEYQGLGSEFRGRGPREEEQINVLRRLWTGEVVDFTGESHRLDRVALNPAPDSQIPIWLGGLGDRAFDRAARMGDGFVFAASFDYAVAGWRDLQERRKTLGRATTPFGAECIVSGRAGLDEVAGRVEAWREAGGTHASILTMRLGLDSVDAHIDWMEKAAAALGLSG